MVQIDTQQNLVILSENLSHSYGDTQALNAVSLTVSTGELFGIIGPDGAGKTTLFRIIASLIEHQQGEIKVLGFDPNKDYRQIRRRIGYMPGRFSLYQDLTVEENLQFYASVFGVSHKDNLQLIQGVYDQIKPFKKRRAGRLSGGMKQKLALSCALIHQPELLILDEPTTGVDAVSRVEFWDLLKELQASGMTILVSTPYMDEATRCDRIALLQKGTVLDLASPAEIASGLQGNLYRISSPERYKLLQAILQTDFPGQAYLNGQFINVIADEMGFDRLKRLLIELGLSVDQAEQITPTVEDRFIQLMNMDHAK